MTARLTLPVLDFLTAGLQRGAGAALPQNRQLYRLLREVILDGRLPSGSKLPSTRQLADALSVARNTVLYAFEHLLAEGYVVARVGAGTFVADTLPDAAPAQPTPHRGASAPAQPVPLSRRGQRVLGNLSMAGRASRYGFAFVPGVPDLHAFPWATWEKLLGRQIKHPNPSWMDYSRDGGHPRLKAAIAQYLRLSRSVECEPEQVLITGGAQQSMDLIARALADAGDVAWLENPGYNGARAAFTAADLAVHPVPIDSEGLAWQDGPHPVPRLIYVTPSHQYPIGTLMSLARRRALLQYAQTHNAWVLEDDYDSEFHFDGRPVAALQGLDTNGRVLYLGTFSKVMFPGLQLGYLVVPRALADTFVSLYARLYREGQLPAQAALAEFIEDGHFSAHIRRMRILYREKRDLMVAGMTRVLGETPVLSGLSGGMHVVWQLPENVDDRQASARLAEVGVVAPPLSKYALSPGVPSGLMLGYAGTDKADLVRAVGLLGKALR